MRLTNRSKSTGTQAHWIITNWQTSDAQLLRALMLSLLSPRFMYAVAFECTERMSTSSVALAIQLIERRLENGVCAPLVACAELVVFEACGLWMSGRYLQRETCK